jgi:hypothetical protein
LRVRGGQKGQGRVWCDPVNGQTDNASGIVKQLCPPNPIVAIPPPPIAILRLSPPHTPPTFTPTLTTTLILTRPTLNRLGLDLGPCPQRPCRRRAPRSRGEGHDKGPLLWRIYETVATVATVTMVPAVCVCSLSLLRIRACLRPRPSCLVRACAVRLQGIVRLLAYGFAWLHVPGLARPLLVLV